jgi:hypothetical protein
MSADTSLGSFVDWMTAEYGADRTYDAIRVLAGGDAGSASLLVRLNVGRGSYYLARQLDEDRLLEVGFATENRTINEAIEQMILDNGGDLDDLLADELCDLGEEPLSMRHYFDRPAFLYVVPLPLDSADALGDQRLHSRTRAIITASRVLFQGCVDEA